MRERRMCGACAVRVPCAHRFGNLSRRGSISIIGHEERSERTRLRDDAAERWGSTRMQGRRSGRSQQENEGLEHGCSEGFDGVRSGALSW